MSYSIIAIVYNPNSTGKSKQKAHDIAERLRRELPKTKVRLRATKRAGHAEAITTRTALTSRHALVISVSGDGGYNEVVNGAMRAQKLGRRITVGLIPAGNANDHYATRHHGDFVKRIATDDEDKIDLIRITYGMLHRRVSRYGHSYIGLGITPQAGEKLNAQKLNLWQEAKIIASVLFQFKSVQLVVGGQVRRYNSLIFSNVGRMSKVIRVPKHTKDDGTVEVSHIYFRNKFKLIAALAQAAAFGLDADERVSSYSFRTTKRTTAQIDGEIIKLPRNTTARIKVAPHTLRCIV